ncbi:MAG: Cna B-type domain-containing protein, partial [Clostridia bacterium]|nr:Cna B-type domain-containing protein [Clostridia bacterium]
MTNHLKRIAALAAALVMLLLVTTAIADYSGKAVISLRIETTGTATLETDTYTVCLKGLNGAPMPEGSVDGVFTQQREGAGTLSFPELTFTALGQYEYEVWQTAGSHPSATSYDDTVYTVRVFATNSSDPAIVIYRDQKTKVEEIVFINEYAEMTITAEKVWNDADNQDGKREGVTLALRAYVDKDGKNQAVAVKDPERFIEADAENRTVSWTGLPVYYKGLKIIYTVEEVGAVERDGALMITMNGAPYTVTIEGNPEDGFVVTNTHEPELIEVSVSKVWDDAGNQDGVRPETLEVFLSNGDSVILSEENHWTATITNLPKYENGVEIEYSWTEENLNDYRLTSQVTVNYHTTLTNTHETEETVVIVTKVWDDNSNQDGVRPDSLTATLSNGMTVVLNKDNRWSASIDDLPKYADGELIEYTWTEVVPEKYELIKTEQIANITIFTNRHVPETVSRTIQKKWVDGENGGKTRPEKITVTLSNGTPVVLNEDNNWTATIDNLPKYDNGVEIEYSWQEVAVPDYEQTGYTIDGDTVIIENTITDPEDVEITGTKTWIDGGRTHDNATEITLTLTRTANGKTETVEATPTWNGNTYTYTGLDKYDDDGYEYTYTVTEVQI